MIMESLRERLVTTAVIYFLFLQLAIRFGIFGPTILDLKHQLNVSQQEMSFIFSVTSVGVCVGAISKERLKAEGAGGEISGHMAQLVNVAEVTIAEYKGSGFLFKWVPKQVGIASLLVVLGIVVSFVTSIHDYYVFAALQFIVGLTSGAAISGCEAWVLEIWAEACAPYMQALQFFRGLGYILGPIIVEPFLEPELEEQVNTTSTTLTVVTEVAQGLALNATHSANSTEEIELTSHIYIPYMINGLMLVLGSVMIFFQYLYTIRKDRLNMTSCSSQATIISAVSHTEQRKHSLCEPKSEEVNENESKREQPKLYIYSLIFLCSIFYLFFFEEVVVTYLASFSANIDLHLSKSRGAFLTSIFNLSNVIGKAIGILLALKLKHFTMLYMNLAIILISLIILMIFSNTSLTMLWFGVCLLGVGLSSIIASLYALMERSLTMDSMVCGILNMSGTLGSVFVPLAIASYIESKPLSLIIASLFCAIACLIILVIIQLLIVLRERKVKTSQLIAEKPDFEIIKF